MPERPLLKLPAPEDIAPPPPPRGGRKLFKPSRKRQGDLFSPKFERLERALDDPTQILEILQAPEAIAPERAIVFEVAESLPAFYEEAGRIGLEYLADDEREIAPDDDFHYEEHPDAPINGRIYLAMPNLEALRQLISLWRCYKSGKRMKTGHSMWSKLFGILKDVRVWGPEDRLSEDTIAAWQYRLSEEPEVPVRFEVELWYRENVETRQKAHEAFEKEVRSLGGTIIDHATIPEIRYDCSLVDLPAVRIRELIDNPSVTLAKTHEIMFIRPQSIAAFAVNDGGEDDPGETSSDNLKKAPPIAALLDGLPVQNHHRLERRLLVDDPDGLDASYEVAARRHGTAMASLIIHGDINKGEPSLDRQIYVRPIMKAVRTPFGWEERTPDDRLLVDHFFRAVRRMKEGDDGEEPIAPSVFLINLSMGDESRQFSGQASPWARFLDYLSFRYNVLFLVSAGNIAADLEISEFPEWSAFEKASPEQRDNAIFAAIDARKSSRTILSPAEAINVLSVGAEHNDAATHLGRNSGFNMDAISKPDLPNLSSRLGLGFRKVVKPDFLVEGGREHIRFKSNAPHLKVAPSPQTNFFGLKAAAPDDRGDLSRTALTSGTSAATALATRAGHLVFDAIIDTSENAMLADTPPKYYPLLAKALLVHGSAWGEGASILENLVNVGHYPQKDNVSRYIGHGVLDTSRIVACTPQRATLIGYGEIALGSASLYRVPLPHSLESVAVPRSVTVTLAWFSPVNPRHQGYRMVSLEAKPGGDKNFSLGVGRFNKQPHDKAITRGSVFHDRRHGKRAVPYVDGGDMLVRVAARKTAGMFDSAIPYAMVATIEVSTGSGIPVYDELRAAIVATSKPIVAPK